MIYITVIIESTVDKLVIWHGTLSFLHWSDGQSTSQCVQVFWSNQVATQYNIITCAVSNNDISSVLKVSVGYFRSLNAFRVRNVHKTIVKLCNSLRCTNIDRYWSLKIGGQNGVNFCSIKKRLKKVILILTYFFTSFTNILPRNLA